MIVLAACLVVAAATITAWFIKNAAQPSAPMAATIQSVTETPGLTAIISSVPLTGTLAPAPLPFIQPQEGEAGLAVFAMRDGNYSHLFLYHPQDYPITRLTNSDWDDADPAISPDETKIAFRSRKNGYWDIYILDLQTDQMTRLTDTPEYDGNPTWSPDGQWIAYESYQGNTPGILIRSVADPAQSPIILTGPEYASYQPAWAPLGREIAFVSARNGNEEIWLARLDQTDRRFVNLSQQPASQDRHPAWSPDGKWLAWSSDEEGVRQVEVRNLEKEGQPARSVALGDLPSWSPDGKSLLIIDEQPNQTYLTGYSVAHGLVLFPGILMAGNMYGMDWGGENFSQLMQGHPFPADARQPAPQLWSPALSVNPLPPGGRFGLVALQGVTAPYPYLHDFADEAFQKMRERTALEAGWNFLDSLENAYQPLTESPLPDMEENWLMTGRSIATNPMPLYAGWMVIVREDYLGRTYWRVYIRARYQDGSQGTPLSALTWDITARYTGSPQAYEEGGKAAVFPSGYWIDFTELARRYRWERLPALTTWRTYYAATRFNQFVLKDGRTWDAAMAEMYPPEALATVTPVPSRTPTPSPTPEDFQTREPTSSPMPTRIPTRRPTWTPSP